MLPATRLIELSFFGPPVSDPPSARKLAKSGRSGRVQEGRPRPNGLEVRHMVCHVAFCFNLFDQIGSVPVYCILVVWDLMELDPAVDLIETVGTSTGPIRVLHQWPSGVQA